MSWADFATELELSVECGGADHTVRWVAGEVCLDQHPDIDAELALVAFGGEEPPCVATFGLWADAVADGGFLGEWVEGEFDRSRRWWLAMALERMRNEGFHEFLREIPLVRARRMGQFLTTFPDAWIDRAACAVAEDLDRGSVPRMAAQLRVAAARRLRHAFVSAIGGQQVPLGAAALVPLSVEVVPAGIGPAGVGSAGVAAEGRLDGRSSRVRLAVDQRWLAEVWGSGAAVIGGELVLSIDHSDDPSVAEVVRWDPSDAGHVARLAEVEVCFDPQDGWRVSRRTGRPGTGPG